MPDLTPGKLKWLEWLFIALAIWGHSLSFLQWGATNVLPGPEAEYFQTFDQILEFSIKEQGQFPLWNPYYFTGVPYVAHPMSHAFNPLISLPVLIFGAKNGFKIALLLGFLVAGLGMWWLGKQLGLTWVGRVWISLMYAFSGVAAAKFIQGQYLMVFGFGWIPFSLAAILAATRHQTRIYLCSAAISLALLFFSGNVYYAYYMLYVILIYTLIAAFRFERNPEKKRLNWSNYYQLGKRWSLAFGLLSSLGLGFIALTQNWYYTYYVFFVAAVSVSLATFIWHTNSPLRLKVDRGLLKTLLIIGTLALGLIAIQLLPSLDYRERYLKTINLALSDSRGIQDIFLDFVSPEAFRPGAFSPQLRPEEFYAYTGWWPFIGLLGLPWAWNAQNRRNILLLIALIVFTLAWIDVKDMPWKGLFQTLPFLYQFRYPSRMVVVGAMALVCAGGLGLDQLWKKIPLFANPGKNNLRHLLLGIVFRLAIGAFLAWSIVDLARVSYPIMQTVEIQTVRNKVAEWLRESDPGIYYVEAPNGWDSPLIENRLRYQNGLYALTYRLSYKDQISDREIVALPKYFILPPDYAVPDHAILVKSIDKINIYQNPASLPFAFTMDELTLTTDTGTRLTAQEVFPEAFSAPNVNTLEGTVVSNSKKVLIVLSTFTPNWQLTIDGKPIKVYSAYGYLAAEVNPGTHTYKFIYRPVWFQVGLIISLGTSLVIIVMLISGFVSKKNHETISA